MRKIWQIIILVMATLYLTGCQPSGISASLENAVAPIAEDNPVATPSGEIAAPESANEPQPVNDECLSCHSDKDRLIETAEPVEEAAESESSGVGWGGDVAPLEPWEKVLVDPDNFLPTVHGNIACTDCHGGTQSADKTTAHTDLIARPSEGNSNACSECHVDVAAVYPNSLHSSLQGYWTALDARSLPENHAALEEAFGNHCANCHTSCGDCHVSQPASVGGGFIEGHAFTRTPSMTRSCTACHGSRVGNEYLGKNEGFPGDVHFRDGRMNCVDCHSSHELHGQPANCTECHTAPEEMTMAPADHRYDGLQSPTCESCHPNTILGKDNIEMHTVHGADLSCQVCHSITYTSCDGCHVAISEKTGNPFFATEATYSTFVIGLNPQRSYTRPYKYVTLRHVPVAQDSFSFYGENLLPNFNALSTWAYATPHNIQRKTPQAETCNACHGNPDIFLTIDKLKPEEVDANLNVIVDEIPSPVEEPTLSE